jgi:hypothetical protein
MGWPEHSTSAYVGCHTATKTMDNGVKAVSVVDEDVGPSSWPTPTVAAADVPWPTPTAAKTMDNGQWRQNCVCG